MKTKKVIIIEEKELRAEQGKLADEYNKISKEIDSSTHMAAAERRMRRRKYNLEGKMEFITELLGDNE